MPNSRLLTSGIVGIAGLLVMVSCGGGGDDESPTTPSQAECEITLLTPEANETIFPDGDFAGDRILEIRWLHEGDAPVMIELLKNGEFIAMIAESAENNGRFDMTFDGQDLAEGDDYQVRVASVDDESCQSTSPMFNIVMASGCDITAMAGHEGGPFDPVPIGDEVHVYFDVQYGSGAVDMELWHRYGYGDEMIVGSIISDYDGAVPYVWTASTLGWVVDGQYLIKVIDSENSDCYQFTNAFIMNP
jgi:hypothetical protein